MWNFFFSLATYHNHHQMEAKRTYKGKDSRMISKLFLAMRFFEKHLADFTTFDPHLNAAYLADWKAAFEGMHEYGVIEDDEDIILADGFLIDDANKVLKKCQAKYKDVKYFAGKAFPDNKEALKEFGEGTYTKVCNSRLRMVQFMETLYGVATKYKTELIAQNYTQAAIDAIATLAIELRDDNNKQQLKKKERPTETRKRIEALNKFYGFGQQVAEAAGEVYRESPVLRDEFRLAQRHHPKTTKSWFALGISGIRKTALTKLLKKYNVSLTNQGKETVEYWQANNINETPSKKHTLTAGEVITVEAEQPVKKFLVVQNTSLKSAKLMLTKEVKEKPEFG